VAETGETISWRCHLNKGGGGRQAMLGDKMKPPAEAGGS
jgi:hypothetical protein